MGKIYVAENRINREGNEQYSLLYVKVQNRKKQMRVLANLRNSSYSSKLVKKIIFLQV
jgi:hypothetical protein